MFGCDQSGRLWFRNGHLLGIFRDWWGLFDSTWAHGIDEDADDKRSRHQFGGRDRLRAYHFAELCAFWLCRLGDRSSFHWRWNRRRPSWDGARAASAGQGGADHGFRHFDLHCRSLYALEKLGRTMIWSQEAPCVPGLKRILWKGRVQSLRAQRAGKNSG